MLKNSKILSLVGGIITAFLSLYLFYYFLTLLDYHEPFDTGAGRVLGPWAAFIGAIYLALVALFGLGAGFGLPRKVMRAAILQVLNALLMILAVFYAFSDYKHPFSIWSFLTLVDFLIFTIAGFLIIKSNFTQIRKDYKEFIAD